MKPYIASHTTETTSKEWPDRPNLPKVGPPMRFRSLAAFQLEEEGTRREAFRFFHHEAEETGAPGPANVNAVRFCIAALNDPSSDVPEEHRRSVWRHLARHLEDAGIEPDPLEERGLEREERWIPVEDTRLEVREGEDDEPPKLVGYASVFGKLSVPMGFGREKVKRGAFLESIRNDDVRALWNHDSNIVLGRMKSGTLKLSEDRNGLKVEITPPKDFQFMETIKRGDVDGMSIRFTAQEQKFTNLDDPEKTVRTILKAKLTEVSPVTFPAFPDTKVAVRCVAQLLAADITDDEWKRNYEDRKRRLKLIEIA